MAKYHISKDGTPRPCSAKTQESCRAEKAEGMDNHYSSVEEASKAYEASQGNEVFEKPMKKRVFQRAPKVESGMEYTLLANEEIKGKRKELEARDIYQAEGNTIAARLEAEGVEFDELLKQIEENKQLNMREAGLGAMYAKDFSVIGMQYTGDFRSEEEYGQVAISKGLRNGTYGPDDVFYEEREDGMGIFAVKGERSYHSVKDIASKNAETAEKRYREWTPGRSLDRLWDIENLPIADIRAKAKDMGIKPMPKTKMQIARAVFDAENEANNDVVRTPAQGEFHYGDVLTIVTDNPDEKATLKKLSEAHQNGSLRFAGSENPFSNGTLFYDERDVPRTKIEESIKTKHAQDQARKLVEATKANLDANGRLFSIRSDVGAGDNVNEGKYFINYYPNVRGEGLSASGSAFGWFSKAELEKISNNDFSPLAKK